jgi:hypothetical protein
MVKVTHGVVQNRTLPCQFVLAGFDLPPTPAGALVVSQALIAKQVTSFLDLDFHPCNLHPCQTKSLPANGKRTFDYRLASMLPRM